MDNVVKLFPVHEQKEAYTKGEKQSVWDRFQQDETLFLNAASSKDLLILAQIDRDEAITTKDDALKARLLKSASQIEKLAEGRDEQNKYISEIFRH